MKEHKTNAVRQLERAGAAFTCFTYQADGPMDGQQVAAKIGVEPQYVYKTLVTRGKSGGHYVFVVPVTGELDLKAAARAVGGKGGGDAAAQRAFAGDRLCPRRVQPSGDEKSAFPRCVDQSARALPYLVVSGGRIGLQIRMEPAALAALVDGASPRCAARDRGAVGGAGGGQRAGLFLGVAG